MSRSSLSTVSSRYSIPPPPPEFDNGADGGPLVPGEGPYTAGDLNMVPGGRVVDFYTVGVDEGLQPEYMGPYREESVAEPRTERSARMYLMSLDRRYKALLFGFFLVGVVGIIILIVLLSQN